jgi:hypothetical protein
MSDSSLVQFWCEGGWGMWTVLLFGCASLGASVRYAMAPGRGRLAFTAALTVTTLISMALAVWTNVAAVMSFLEDPARVPDAEVTRVLFQGLKEASRPGTLGGVLLTLVALVAAVGVRRSEGARAENAARVAVAG